MGASLPNGTIIALDLTAVGSAVTGTMLVGAPESAISASLTDVTLTGTMLSFSVSLGGPAATFTGEVAGGEFAFEA